MKKLLAAMFVALLMGGCRERGDETEFERTKALAEDGDAVAQHKLGYMYTLGKGVPRDFA